MDDNWGYPHFRKPSYWKMSGNIRNIPQKHDCKWRLWKNPRTGAPEIFRSECVRVSHSNHVGTLWVGKQVRSLYRLRPWVHPRYLSLVHSLPNHMISTKHITIVYTYTKYVVYVYIYICIYLILFDYICRLHIHIYIYMLYM